MLAIAGLIFLMVFIALPALQRSQRDTQRRNDISKVSAMVTQYQANNNGKLPVTSGNAYKSVDSEDTSANGLPCASTATGGKTGTCKGEQAFISNYMNSADAAYNMFVDPSGWTYGLTIEKATKGVDKNLSASDFQNHMIYIITSALCDGESAVYSDKPRDYAIMYRLEGSGTYCLDNSSV